MFLSIFKEIKALIEGRARERARAPAPLREETEINEGTYIFDGGFPLRSAFQGRHRHSSIHTFDWSLLSLDKLI